MGEHRTRAVLRGRSRRTLAAGAAMIFVGAGVCWFFLGDRESAAGAASATPALAEVARATRGAAPAPVFDATPAPPPGSAPAVDEERLIMLQLSDSGTNARAAALFKELVLGAGFREALRADFPELKPAQIAGVFLDAKVEDTAQGRMILIRTGIRSSEALERSREIANRCETLAREICAPFMPPSWYP